MLSPAVLSVIGAFLIHICLGSLYLWGNITIMVTSYLKVLNPELTYSDTLLIYASALGAQGIFMLIGGILETKIGLKNTILLGGGLFSLSTMFASFCTTLFEFIVVYGICFGAGIGISYAGPIVCCANWYPNKNGMITGLIVAGFGSGAFIFGPLAIFVVNPDGLNVDEATSYFPSDSPVIQNVPIMFKTLGIVYAVIIFIAYNLITENKAAPASSSSSSNALELLSANQLNKTSYQQISNSSSETGDSSSSSSSSNSRSSNSSYFMLDPYQSAQNSLVWHVSFCFVCTTIGAMFLAGNNKVYAEPSFNNETYLSIVVSVSSVFNGMGRIVWGVISDYLGPINALLILSFFFTFVIYFYSIITQTGNQTLFALWTFMLMFFGGGNFALYLPTTILLFGSKYATGNYGLIFTVYSLCNVINIVYLASLGISFDSACIILGTFCLVGFLSLLLLSYRVASHKVITKHFS